MNITIGWWALPLIITIGSFWHFRRQWVRSRDGVGRAIEYVLAFGAAANVSLVAWLAWSLCMWLA